MSTKTGKHIMKKVKGLQQNRFHCEFCGHLLAKGKLTKGAIEFKCPKCNEKNSFVTLKAS